MVDSACQLEDLLARCALKDRDALSRLYELTSAQLFAAILRIVNRRDVAEDILQEAFINIWNRSGQFNSQRGGAFAWMMQISRNKSIDWLRGNPAGREFAQDALTDLRDPDDLPDAQCVQMDELRALMDCLEELDAPQRTAIQQVYYRGFTHHEYATQSGHPLGTIKSWLRRGLQQLKRCLQP